MDKYPALDLVIRFGAAGGLALSIALAVLLGILLAPALGLLAWPVGAGAGALIFLICKSFVEIATIVCEMLVPR